jgi:hypothetical protein
MLVLYCAADGLFRSTRAKTLNRMSPQEHHNLIQLDLKKM